MSKAADAIVFVVDDDAAMRDSLRWLLQSVGFAVRTCASAEEFLAVYDPAQAGCLVLDIRMPGIGGLGLQAELAARQIELPVIIITGHAEVPTAVRAFKAGAFDFLEKPFGDQLLLDRVRQAVDRDRQRRLARAEREAAVERLQRLTPREREVMDRVIVGQPNKVIAIDLGISPKTVEVHRAQVMRRMKVQSVAELVRLVLRAQSDSTNT
jgi:two-component system response regulator FixJ